jgi:hypothetical protein
VDDRRGLGDRVKTPSRVLARVSHHLTHPTPVTAPRYKVAKETNRQALEGMERELGKEHP